MPSPTLLYVLAFFFQLTVPGWQIERQSHGTRNCVQSVNTITQQGSSLRRVYDLLSTAQLAWGRGELTPEASAEHEVKRRQEGPGAPE